MVYELILRRFWKDKEASQGFLYEKSPTLSFIGFTCEDQEQTKKVLKETRIPGNGKRYRIVINRELTEKTKKYRSLYPAWFKFHLMLNDVEGFTGIYIHIGNDDDDTEGCLLIGDKANSFLVYNRKGQNRIEESTNCFKRFYEKYYPLLENNENQVYITILDEIF